MCRAGLRGTNLFRSSHVTAVNQQQRERWELLKTISWTGLRSNMMRPQSEITTADDAPAEKKQNTERFLTPLNLIQLLQNYFQQIYIKSKRSYSI